MLYVYFTKLKKGRGGNGMRGVCVFIKKWIEKNTSDIGTWYTGKYVDGGMQIIEVQATLG